MVFLKPLPVGVVISSYQFRLEFDWRQSFLIGFIMSTWHRATIKFQYSVKIDLNHRGTTQVTTQVYGNTESAAMQTLKKMYPNWDNFVILEIELKN